MPLSSSLSAGARSRIVNTSMNRKTGRHPDTASALVRYHEGRLAFENGNFEEAAALLFEAAALGPTAPMLEMLGESLIELGRLDQAVDHLAHATKAAPRSYRAFYLLGRAERRRGRVSSSARAFRRALAINPHYRKAREELDLLLPNCGEELGEL